MLVRGRGTATVGRLEGIFFACGRRRPQPMRHSLYMRPAAAQQTHNASVSKSLTDSAVGEQCSNPCPGRSSKCQRPKDRMAFDQMCGIDPNSAPGRTLVKLPALTALQNDVLDLPGHDVLEERRPTLTAGVTQRPAAFDYRAFPLHLEHGSTFRGRLGNQFQDARFVSHNPLLG